MTGHYIHKFKHLGCSLHFVVMSYAEYWPEGEGHKMYCPECGGTEGFIRWSEKTDKQIFELIPGATAMAGIV